MKRFYIIFVFCVLFGFVQVASAQTATSCTGEIRTNLTDAQACANTAQQQGSSLGYNTSCTVEKVPLVAGVDPLSGLDYYYNTTCTVNGSTGHSAYLLAGFQAAPGSNAIVQQVPAGWDILKTELQYETAYRQCGGTPYVVNGSYSCTGPAGSQPTIMPSTKVPTSTSGSTNTTSTTNTVNSASSAANTTEKNLFDFGKNFATTAINNFSQTTNSIINPTGASSTTTSGSSCVVPSRNLSQGDSGTDVTNLTNILVKEGLMTTPQSTFDTTVFNAVVAYQEKYKADILTPLGLTSGTGFVGDSTRAFMQKKCSGSTTPTTGTTTSGMPTVFYPESNAYCSVVRPFPISATRLKIASQANGAWVGFGEIQIYDMQGNLIKPTEVYDGLQHYGNDVGWNAFDGNLQTSFNGGPSTTCTPEYCWHSATLYVNLGGLKQISKVKFLNRSVPAPAQANHWIMYTADDRFGQELQASKISGNLQGETWYETCSKDTTTAQ